MLPIFGAAHAATQAGKCNPLGKEICVTGEHISLKLNIIPRVIQRINDESQKLYETAKHHGPEHVFTKDKEGYAFPVDNDLKYLLIADIEAFLFEANACWELMKFFFCQMHAHVGHILGTRDEIKQVINDAHERRHKDVSWISLLDRERNFVAHDGAGYLAIDVSEPNKWELLIMKGNFVRFDNEKKFFTQSDLQKISKGFTITKAVLQDELLMLFNTLGCNP